MKRNLSILLAVVLLLSATLACGSDAAPAATEAPAAAEDSNATEAPAASEGGISPMPGASDLSESDWAAIDSIVTEMTPRLSGGLDQNGYDAYAMPADTTYADVLAYYKESGIDLGASDTDDLGNGVRGAGWGSTQIDTVLLYIPLDDKVVVVTVYTN